MGRFLKEHGKSDKTKAGKMMIGEFDLKKEAKNITHLFQRLGRR